MRTRCRVGLALPVLLAVTGCASGSRLWRLFPFSSSDESSDERLNGFPLLYSDGAATSVLWPLMDFDGRGFAVRPLVSKDGSEWDLLYPLAHFDTESGDGWALTGYSTGDSAGLFPLCHFGPSFGFVLPAWWCKEDGDVSSWGVFPIAWADADADNGQFLTAYWIDDDFGLFPLFHSGPHFGYVGPVWWTQGSDAGDSGCGLFPILWTEQEGDASSLTLLPLYHHHLEPGHELRAALLPPTWWETEGDVERHVVFPLFAHLDEGDAESSWYTPLANGWRDELGGGLNVYPLWWSSHEGERATQLLVPFYWWEERGDERLLLTPLGGRGWDASGAETFTNVLGPLFHHSAGPDRESAAFLWPLFERERRGEETQTRAFPLFDVTTDPYGHDAWMAAGLARHVADARGRSFRLWPLWSDCEADETPDLLFDLALATRHERPAEKTTTASLLLGLGRVETTEEGSAWRLFPLASASTDPEADGWLDPLTLYRHEERGETTSDRLFPLYAHESGPDGSETDLLLSFARLRSTPEGTSWRLWPLVSSTASEADEEVLDWCSLIGSRRDSSGSSLHVGTPLLFGMERGGDSWSSRLLTLFHCGREVREAAPPAAEDEAGAVAPPRLVERAYAGFLFDWFLAERSVVESGAGERRTEAHWRVPLLHEYEKSGDTTEWDALLYAVHSVERPEEATFSVLGYAYRSVRTGETTRRDIFPFVTCDDGPDSRRFSFLWRLFDYERKGDRSGGHVLFIPWGDDV